MNPVKRACVQILFVVAGIGPLAQSLRAQDGRKVDAAFNRVDTNRDGELSKAEIEELPPLKPRLVGADSNGDQTISKAEFVKHMMASRKTGMSPVGVAASGKLVHGDSIRTLKVGDLQRRFLVHVPASYQADQLAPLVIAFHGGGGNPSSMVRLSGLNDKSDEAGFVVAYPYGSNRDPENGLTYNGGGCCGYAMAQKIDDVGFTAALIDDLILNGSIDKSRVYATGLSNGGIMAHRVGAELSERIAAIAPIGGPLMLDEFAPKHPVSVMHFHGTKDELAPYEGGKGKGTNNVPARMRPTFASVDSTIAAWVRVNGCQTSPQTELCPDSANDGMTSSTMTYAGGKANCEVIHVKIEGGGHTWPGQPPLVELLGPSTRDISANDMMWDFFKRHTR
jgi:poly(3-hydroxybutyrate) depolymerase